MERKHITHIFFDIGSILLRRKHDLWAVASECLEVSRDDYANAVAAINENHLLIQLLWKEAKTLEKEREFYGEFTRELQKRLGLAVDEEKTKYLVDVFTRRTYDLTDGTHEILAWLKKQGYTLGVISNAPVSRRHYEMKEHELEQYFDVVVLSRDIAVDKPHPDIYKHALALAGTTADKSAMIDDKLENLEAAQDIGFAEVVLFGDLKGGFYQENIHRILRLEELKEIF